MNRERKSILKILSQDRSFIAELGRECWVTKNGKCGYLIVHRGYVHSYLGIYKEENRAMEVLEEIFSHYKDNEETYEMPIE